MDQSIFPLKGIDCEQCGGGWALPCQSSYKNQFLVCHVLSRSGKWVKIPVFEGDEAVK